MTKEEMRDRVGMILREMAPIYGNKVADVLNIHNARIRQRIAHYLYNHSRRYIRSNKGYFLSDLERKYIKRKEKGMEGKISRVQRSTLFTKAVASRHDPRQSIPKGYEIPEYGKRLHLARLVTEEYLELMNALGFNLRPMNGPFISSMENAHLEPTTNYKGDLEPIIDAACDSIYVNTNVLTACGAPDLPHLEEVCRANEAKFPGGKAVIDEGTGKYLKPKNWTPPSHSVIADAIQRQIDHQSAHNLQTLGEAFVADALLATDATNR